jgi:3-oxoacyl-[acyl-carrier-protein] synthase I
MPPQDVVVVGIGMMTAVGLSAAETAAAVRAATARFSSCSVRDRHSKPFTLAQVIDEGLPDLAEPLDRPGLTARERRMLRLATQPLIECLHVLPRGEPRPGLHLALPELETTRRLDGNAFLGWLVTQAPGLFDPSLSDASARGRAGGLLAVGRAADQLRKGYARFAIAGGVDTYRDLYILGTLDVDGRIKSDVNLDGFIPGEGAAFLLLTTQGFAASSDLAVFATISPLALGEELGHLYSSQPYRGDGLATTLLQVVQPGAAPAQIQDVYSSMNGESHWAKEWGVAFLRNRHAFREDHGMHHPADCYGDIGAATGPTMVGLAALGIAGAYRQPPCLIYCSSDYGPRTALTASA